jgi:hypothetical protein
MDELDANPSVGRRSTINWHKSSLLIKHESPQEPIDFDDVEEYLDQVEEYAIAVLADVGIVNPVIPLSMEDRRKLFDEEHFEHSADANVAVKLLENAGFLKGLLTHEAPTPHQVRVMLWLMAEISALTSMPHLAAVQRERARKDMRVRNEKIRTRRKQGEKVSVLAAEYKITERQILKICEG